MKTTNIRDLLEDVQHGKIMLPEFQRRYVWKRDQVRGLMESLYREHPTGHLLIWKTYKPGSVRVRGPETDANPDSQLLLDGQQRLTTLYVLFNGKPPPFYEDEEGEELKELFSNLKFNMKTGVFQFWKRSLMGKNPLWIDLHEFLSKGMDKFCEDRKSDEDRRASTDEHRKQLNYLDKIREYEYAVDEIRDKDIGDDITVVVNIFNRINRAGTTLKRADIALAHICIIWPGARAELRKFQEEMRQHGFDMDFDFLIRCLAGVATGSVLLEGSFLKVSVETLQDAWKKMQPAFDYLVRILRRESFIDSAEDLPTDNVLIPVTVFLARKGEDGRFPNDAVKHRFIRWIHLAGLWQRYSGSAETKLQKDVTLVSGSDPDPTPELEKAILRDRGRVKVEAEDLKGASINSAFARLSHIVARAHPDGSDWFTGDPLYDKSTGRSNGKKEHHHIFPKSVLVQAGYGSDDDQKRINELANRVLLTQQASAEIQKKMPADYLADIDENKPGALKAQSVPRDKDLWAPACYIDFLEARRRRLADAINEFIESWKPKDTGARDEQTVRDLMKKEESEGLEFKSTLRWDLKEGKVSKDIEKAVVKGVAGFLNCKGGTLLVGVSDVGKTTGLKLDYETFRKKDRDGFQLRLLELIGHHLGEATSSFLTITFHEIDGQDICQISIEKSDDPVYMGGGVLPSDRQCDTITFRE